MRKMIIIFFVFSVLSVFSGVYLFADENPTPTQSSTVPATSSADNESVLRKLDKIMNTQAQILQQLNEIKDELQIVKIRASQK